MANDIKDLTASTFGLLIAYLLPGLLALYTLSLWFTPLSPIFTTFTEAESTAGLFVLVLLGGLLLGVELTAFRWVVFECWICRRERLQASDFERLADEKRMAAFRIAVDEHYR